MKHMIEIFIFAQFRALCPIANRKDPITSVSAPLDERNRGAY